VEPDSPNDCLQTSYGYDLYGNVTSESQSACAGASGYTVYSAGITTLYHWGKCCDHWRKRSAEGGPSRRDTPNQFIVRRLESDNMEQYDSGGGPHYWRRCSICQSSQSHQNYCGQSS
jgi:hypothetical protein